MLESSRIIATETSWCALCEKNTVRQPCFFKPLNSQLVEQVETAPAHAEGWLLTRCQVCGVVSVDPLPSEKELLPYYSSDYYSEDIYHGGIGDWMMQKPLEGDCKKWPWSQWSRNRALAQQIDHLRNLANLVPDAPQKSLRFLDIGCGTGEALVAACELGWEGLGIEVSSSAAEQARRKSSMPVICGTWETVSLEAQTFDIIHLREVLEHVRAPGALLRRVVDWLRPGGILYVQVPNDLEGYRSRLFGNAWWIFPPTHLHYFTPSVLSEALAGFGLRVVSAGSISAIGVDLRRYLSWHLGLLSFTDHLQRKRSLGGIAFKLFQVGWDHGMFWPVQWILNHTMEGFTFWLVARKNASVEINQ